MAYVFGLWPNKSMDFSNLTAHGGFLPFGIGGITAAIVTVIFSMTGAEVATIAAAESKDPERAVAKAANSVIARIAIFYVGSIFLLTVILPWNDKTVAASPFVAAFTKMGIPYADDVMNAVVLTAVLSCLNSGMYTASRMLFVLAARREAPLQLVSVTKRGVPAVAILASSIVGFLCVIAAAVSPDTVFAFLLNSSGAIILFVYVLIGISQIVLRRRSGSEHLRVKMWLFPGLSIFTVLGIVAILAQMGIEQDSRSQLVLSLLSWAVVIAFYFANKWFIARRPVPQEMRPGPGAAAGAGAGQRDRELRRAARRAAPHRRRPGRPLLRRGARQPRRDRCRGHARPARRHGGHPGGGPGPARPHPVHPALGEPAGRRRAG